MLADLRHAWHFHALPEGVEAREQHPESVQHVAIVVSPKVPLPEDVHGDDRARSHHVAHDVRGKHVHVTPINEIVETARPRIFVAQRWQVASQRHAGADVAPEGSVPVHHGIPRGEVRRRAAEVEPEILNLEPRRRRPSQVGDVVPQVAHPHAKRVRTSPQREVIRRGRVQRSDEGPNARPGHHVDGDVLLLQDADHTQVRHPARAAAPKDEPDRPARQDAPQPRKVAAVVLLVEAGVLRVEADVVVAVDLLPILDPSASPLRRVAFWRLHRLEDVQHDQHRVRFVDVEVLLEGHHRRRICGVRDKQGPVRAGRADVVPLRAGAPVRLVQDDVVQLFALVQPAAHRQIGLRGAMHVFRLPHFGPESETSGRRSFGAEVVVGHRGRDRDDENRPAEVVRGRLAGDNSASPVGRRRPFDADPDPGVAGLQRCGHLLGHVLCQMRVHGRVRLHNVEQQGSWNPRQAAMPRRGDGRRVRSAGENLRLASEGPSAQMCQDPRPRVIPTRGWRFDAAGPDLRHEWAAVLDRLNHHLQVPVKHHVDVAGALLPLLVQAVARVQNHPVAPEVKDLQDVRKVLRQPTCRILQDLGVLFDERVVGLAADANEPRVLRRAYAQHRPRPEALRASMPSTVPVHTRVCQQTQLPHHRTRPVDGDEALLLQARRLASLEAASQDPGPQSSEGPQRHRGCTHRGRTHRGRTHRLLSQGDARGVRVPVSKLVFLCAVSERGSLGEDVVDGASGVGAASIAFKGLPSSLPVPLILLFQARHADAASIEHGGLLLDRLHDQFTLHDDVEGRVREAIHLDDIPIRRHEHELHCRTRAERGPIAGGVWTERQPSSRAASSPAPLLREETLPRSLRQHQARPRQTSQTCLRPAESPSDVKRKTSLTAGAAALEAHEARRSRYRDSATVRGSGDRGRRQRRSRASPTDSCAARGWERAVPVWARPRCFQPREPASRDCSLHLSALHDPEIPVHCHERDPIHAHHKLSKEPGQDLLVGDLYILVDDLIGGDTQKNAPLQALGRDGCPGCLAREKRQEREHAGDHPATRDVRHEVSRGSLASPTVRLRGSAAESVLGRCDERDAALLDNEEIMHLFRRAEKHSSRGALFLDCAPREPLQQLQLLATKDGPLRKRPEAELGRLLHALRQGPIGDVGSAAVRPGNARATHPRVHALQAVPLRARAPATELPSLVSHPAHVAIEFFENRPESASDVLRQPHLRRFRLGGLHATQHLFGLGLDLSGVGLLPLQAVPQQRQKSQDGHQHARAAAAQLEPLGKHEAQRRLESLLSRILSRP
eukprot:scaffold873_cov252-Pinguiococcus_pyrenoidosus.AAC.13